MSKEYLEAKAEDISKLLYEVYDVPSGICEQIKNMVQRLEAIDNINPSEALECLERIDNTLCLNNIKGKLEFGIDTEEHTDCDSVIGMTEDLETIEQALLKAQEPKHYLKWEDLEFDNNAEVKKYLKVKLGENIYSAFYHYSFLMNCEMFCIERDTLSLYITDKQFFNDLRLERVE